MPSSPAEQPDAATVLRAVTRGYEAAFAAARDGDLAGCDRVLAACGELLAHGAAPAAAPDAPPLDGVRRDAVAAHGRLLLLLRGLRDEVGDELARARQGQRALAGYGGERRVGDRFEDRV